MGKEYVILYGKRNILCSKKKSLVTGNQYTQKANEDLFLTDLYSYLYKSYKICDTILLSGARLIVSEQNNLSKSCIFKLVLKWSKHIELNLFMLLYSR